MIFLQIKVWGGPDTWRPSEIQRMRKRSWETKMKYKTGREFIMWNKIRGKSKYAEDRFFENSIRVYKVLDKILEKNNFLASNDYSIADIATFPWIARHEWHDIGLKNYKNLARWYVEISKRPAVKKGFDCLNTGEKIPVV